MNATLPKPSEAEIQKAILELLAYRRIFRFRVNQQGVPTHRNDGSWRPSPTRGVADILGILPGGRFLAIEVKRPGGKLTQEQALFLSLVNANGGLGFVATSTRDVEERLTKAEVEKP